MTKLGDAVEHNVANEHASYLSLNKAEQPYQSHPPLARIILLTLAHMRRCESIPPPSDRAPLRRWPQDRFLARVRVERERQGRSGGLTELVRGRGEHAIGVSSTKVGDARRTSPSRRRRGRLRDGAGQPKVCCRSSSDASAWAA